MNDRLQIPYIAALGQPLAVACSEYPWGPVECLLAVFVLAALLRIAPSTWLVAAEAEAVARFTCCEDLSRSMRG